MEIKVIDDKVFINGVELELPEGKQGNNITITRNSIYVDGYELKNGKWNKTLTAFWNKYF